MRLLAEADMLKARLKRELTQEALLQIPSPLQDQVLWGEALYIAVAARRYGVIYWLSRKEAKACVARCHREPEFRALILRADRALGERSDRIIDQAVLRYLSSPFNRLQTTTASVLAPHAIASTGRDEFLVRTSDLVGWHTGLLDRVSGVFDLHDFAHQLCAAINPRLFGNKYHPALARLSVAQRQLVTSPNRNTGAGSPFTDGLVFSELLNGLFVDAWRRSENSEDIVGIMAETLCAFYSAERGILHPTSGRVLKPARPMSFTELAILLRNKHYELPASEVEQHLFTRGGEPGRGDPTSDDLVVLSVLGRIEAIANAAGTWRYFEKRNTLKHRAHFAAYGLYFRRQFFSCADSAVIASLARQLAWEPVDWEEEWAPLEPVRAEVRSVAPDRGALHNHA